MKSYIAGQDIAIFEESMILMAGADWFIGNLRWVTALLLSLHHS